METKPTDITLKSIRIIHIALALGPVLFAGVIAILYMEAQMSYTYEINDFKINLLWLYGSGLATILGVFFAPFVGRRFLSIADRENSSNKTKYQRFQILHIGRIAIYEFFVLFSSVAIIHSINSGLGFSDTFVVYFPLISFLVFIALMIANFPTETKIENELD